MLFDYYKSLNLRWYHEVTFLLIAAMSNGYIIHVSLIQNEVLKFITKHLSEIIWIVAVYCLLAVGYGTLRNLVVKESR